MAGLGLKSVAIIIPWFGPWPPWLDLFLLSCRYNDTIDWVIYSDNDAPEQRPDNVSFRQISLADYLEKASRALGLEFRWDKPYKLCDIRPAFGVIHAEDMAGYDYWGFGDMDVIYGDIRGIYTPDILNEDIISTHPDRVSGHFTLIRNTDRMANAYKRVPFWRHLLSVDRHVGFDEGYFSRLFVPKWREEWLRRPFSPFFMGGGLFVERFSTGLGTRPWIDGSMAWPEYWRWREGKLFAGNAGEREFLYLHFTNWQSSRWLRGGQAAWSGIEQLVPFDVSKVNEFFVSKAGFSDTEPMPVTAEDTALARRSAG